MTPFQQLYEADAASLLAAFDSAGIGHAITNKEGHLKWCSPAYREQLGIKASDIGIPTPWFLLDDAPEDLKRDRAKLWKAFLENGTRWQGIVRWHLKNGNVRFCEGTAIPNGADEVVLINNDRTDRILARQKMRETEELQRQVMDDLPLSICSIRPDTTISQINRYLPLRLGKDPDTVLGMTARDAFGPELDALAHAICAEIKLPSDAIDGRSINITEGPLAGSHWLLLARPLISRSKKLAGVVIIALDRTDSVKLRLERAAFADAVHETQKITALNDFAGSLAHELSNLLHPIGAYARILTAQPDHPNRAQFTKLINQSAMHAGRILKRTLSMAHTDRSAPQLIDVVPLIEETISSAQDLAPQGLEHVLTTPQRAMAVAQPGEMRQVLLNLLNNAAEAMHYKGRISIRVDTDLAKPDALDLMPLAQPPFVRVSVTDEGPGMNDDIRARIFEPFFTTKAVGRGTGLGLAVVQGLVTGWGGVISVETAPGKGSTFHVWISQKGMRV